ncbi:Pal1 cell morphology [Lasallia pustulata]|uniref:Pal1 cell morphology n=1 Tax=Lasallia pustulata TaxID=136370 RepID=A0A1W5CWM8_9LECA|nr:Pal1 cell morphology [Lasallia pustulata]
MPATTGRISPTKTAFTGKTAELFDNLTLADNSASTNSRQVMPPPSTYLNYRPENVPPPANLGPGLGGHRPSRSQDEDQQKTRNGARCRAPLQGLDVFADPPGVVKDGEGRRPRRNSDSSAVSSKPLDSEEERRRKERRHKDREARRDGKGRPHASSSSKAKKPNQRLDIIDKLDVTSIYGTGLFHHDGPFDACNPHRNRKGSQRAPMQAFPANSANNVLGGSGPVNKNIDMAQFHGRGAEGFTDFSASGVRTNKDSSNNESYELYNGASAPSVKVAAPSWSAVDPPSFNPTARVEPVHGDESMGLGTSTFLEGAPASRAALQRRESETDGSGFGSGGGLSRKKSLAQKIRGISNPNRSGVTGRMTSPETVPQDGWTSPTEALSAGGVPRIKESKPFFSDYDEAYEKKGARIQIAEEQNRVGGEGGFGGGRLRAPSSPMRAPPNVLERRVTNDGYTSSAREVEGDGKSGGGFLSRVRSLKGGRKARPERREFP